ncbi:MAG: hypothetical protein SH809_18360 [Rhodothermales bacterium]|nr:hypothetical protein [Rhodothermales bacterium]
MHTAYENKSWSPWWGTYHIPEGLAGCWEVGPCTIWVASRPNEWRIARFQLNDAYVDAAEVRTSLEMSEMMAFIEAKGEAVSLHRFGFRVPGDEIYVRPRLADRAVVVQPEMPLHILPREEVTLYISTPLWVQFEAGSPRRVLQEFPLYRPSDTWFGESTIHGELCYAGRTAARLRLQDLTVRPYRVITPVRVKNRAQDGLLLNRIQVLVQYLSIFEATNGHLWTQMVTVERERSGDFAAMKIGVGAPAEAGETTRLESPRRAIESNLIFRAFGGLFKDKSIWTS